MKTSEILAKAADVIEQRGWTQGVYTDDSGRCCALGAIGVVMGRPPYGLTIPAERALAGHLALDLEADELAVATWNDAPDRTAEQVTTAMRAAAAGEREAGR